MDIMQKLADLDRQRETLLQKAHDEKIKVVEEAIAELNALGFNYRLAGGKAAILTPTVGTGKRRTGVRDDVLNVIKNASEPISPAEIAEHMDMTDKSGRQSVANALSALKKSELVEAKGGKYSPM